MAGRARGAPLVQAATDLPEDAKTQKSLMLYVFGLPWGEMIGQAGVVRTAE